MLSRVADSIYWMSRYIERAENIARFIDVNLHLMLDLPVKKAEQWEPLVTTTGDGALFVERYGAGGATRENVIRYLTVDASYPSSIVSCLRAARENARSIREVISSEMWEQLNRFYLRVKDAGASEKAVALDSPHELFNEVKLGSQLFGGVADATMSHGEAWHFGRLGREIERAEKTSRILDMKCYILLPGDAEPVSSTFDNIQWAAVLKSVSALEMYRKRFHRIDPGRVAQFLIFDREFPRAMCHCLVEAEGSLRAIARASAGTSESAPERLLGRLRSELDLAEGSDVLAEGLHAFLDRFQASLNRLGDEIFDTFHR